MGNILFDLLPCSHFKIIIERMDLVIPKRISIYEFWMEKTEADSPPEHGQNGNGL